MSFWYCSNALDCNTTLQSSLAGVLVGFPKSWVWDKDLGASSLFWGKTQKDGGRENGKQHRERGGSIYNGHMEALLASNKGAILLEAQRCIQNASPNCPPEEWRMYLLSSQFKGAQEHELPKFQTALWVGQASFHPYGSRKQKDTCSMLEVELTTITMESELKMKCPLMLWLEPKEGWEEISRDTKLCQLLKVTLASSWKYLLKSWTCRFSNVFLFGSLLSPWNLTPELK